MPKTVNKDSQIISYLVKMTPSNQFYSKEWQEGEIQADQDILQGNVVGPFEKVENALKALKEADV